MNIEARERLAKIVKSTRGERTQRAFARDLGVSYTAIQDWEKARTIPGTDNLEKIADKAGLTLQELLEYLEFGEKAKVERLPTGKLIKELEVMPLEELMKVADVVYARLKGVATHDHDKEKV